MMTTRAPFRPPGSRFYPAMAAALWLFLPGPAGILAAEDLPERPSKPLDIREQIGGVPAHGTVSANRSTFDGRVRLSGNRGEAGHKIFVSRPEVFRGDLASDRRSSDGPRYRIEVDGLHASDLASPIADHVTICDPYLADGRRKNPYVCSAGSRPADCYDIDIVVIVHAALPGEPGARSELWTAPVTVTVDRPKTRRADIAGIELRGAPVRSPIERVPAKAGEILSEPVVSGDGRLLFVNSGDTLLYSVMGSGEEGCNARNWKRLDHVSRMHKDPRMRSYGVARYPIRDSENRRVKAGRPVRGAYPWIDRHGKNLFFTQVGGAGLFFEDSAGELRSRFDVVNAPKARRIELGGPTRLGLSYFGLWSQGKIVIPEGRFNNADFHFGRQDYEPRVRLYADSEPSVLGVGSTSKINTVENQWSYSSSFLARAPRDIAWWVSASNGMTGEVGFDEVLDLGSLIYSAMNAAVENKRLAWRDGFDYRKGRGYVKTPRVQNSAASQLRWKLPSYGRLFGARVEPVAAGGVVGKGLWLAGDRGRLEYVIPEQDRAAMAAATWTTALAVDPRDLSRRRRLLDFPDGSFVDLESGRLIVGDGLALETSVVIPASLALRTGSWTHLAFISRPGSVDVFVQGFKLATRPLTLLRPKPGRLVLGKPAGQTIEGFRGWVDDLLVTSGERHPESVCNFAGGTLRGLAQEDGQPYAAAGAYPRSSHEEISALLQAGSEPVWERYRCDLDRFAPDACLTEIHQPGGAATACVRAGLLFPEGPLFFDRPRPDSRRNAFCGTCHSRSHPTPTLRTGRPLAPGPPDTELGDDRRRQPAQAPPRIHGYLPRGFLGLSDGVEAPPDGLPLDWLLYRSAESGASPR